jgi:hypothetical protein
VEPRAVTGSHGQRLLPLVRRSSARLGEKVEGTHRSTSVKGSFGVADDSLSPTDPFEPIESEERDRARPVDGSAEGTSAASPPSFSTIEAIGRRPFLSPSGIRPAYSPLDRPNSIGSRAVPSLELREGKPPRAGEARPLGLAPSKPARSGATLLMLGEYEMLDWRPERRPIEPGGRLAGERGVPLGEL